MYYKIKNDCYFRVYGDIGYLTSTGLFHDRVVNTSGAIFLSMLSKQPKSLLSITKELFNQFIDVEDNLIKEDATLFFNMLVEDGFLTSGLTPEEAIAHDKQFTYAALDPITVRADYSNKISRVADDTQTKLDEYFSKNPTIFSFQIELTSKCNERCVHCYIPHELKLDVMEESTFYDLLNQLKQLGTWHITLSGGEPMLHPKFAEFVRAIKLNDMYVTVLSNLTLLNDEILDALSEGNPASVQVSLYSMDAEHHDSITCLPGSHKQTLASIKQLLDRDIPVQINCPTLQENANDYGEVLRWAHAHKIRAFTDYSISAKYNHDISNLEHRLSPIQCKKVILDILNWDEEYQSEILSDSFINEVDNFKIGDKDRFCNIGISSCCIVSDGSIYPCSGWQDYSCGNINESTLKDIWENSEELNRLRKLKRTDLKPCLSCDSAAFCSPCLVRNANESPTGDPFEISPYFCEVAKVNKNLVMQWREEHLPQ